MPLITTVIDDRSPLISYDATWLLGSAWDDQYASNYYLGTFTTNNVTDGVVSFNFNGTGIWIYGANRPNHGSYTVQVDSATYSGFNGAGNNLFQQSLFNTSTLTQGTHAVKLTNTATGNLYVDIDMIVWQSEVGNTGDELVTEVVQDADPRFQYQEPAWDTASSVYNFNLFGNGTGHVTETYDASVTFTFTVSEAVTLYGTSGPYNGPYSVKLDNGQAVTYNATNAYPTNYGVVIYHADNLGSGSHQVILTNLPAGSGQALTIDYAQLWSLANTTSLTGTTPPSPGSLGSTSSASQNNLSSGAIAGIAVAAAAAALCAAAAIFFYRRWRAALSTHNGLYRLYTPQQPPTEAAMVATTGFSSSLETRSDGTVLRNDTSTQGIPGRVQRPADNYTTQHDGDFHLPSSSRDSRSLIDAMSSLARSPVDENSGQRPLPEAPGGGLSLSAEFPKLAGAQPHQNIIPSRRTSIAMSDVPPDYIQATGNAVA